MPPATQKNSPPPRLRKLHRAPLFAEADVSFSYHHRVGGTTPEPRQAEREPLCVGSGDPWWWRVLYIGLHSSSPSPLLYRWASRCSVV